MPAWYEVSGTTGSPSFTSSSSTVPVIGARMIDSTLGLPRLLTRPFSIRASFSVERFRRIWASWMSLSACSQSWLERMPCSLSVLARSYFLLRLVVDVPRDLDLAPRLGQLERRRVGQDLEERIAGPDDVADLAERRLDDAGDLALDRDLRGPDGADRQRLLDDGRGSPAPS